jgi:hypothetical protein
MPMPRKAPPIDPILLAVGAIGIVIAIVLILALQ